ncbi:MAG: serine hydrolase, partial [Bryobacteraceae bacterium]
MKILLLLWCALAAPAFSQTSTTWNGFDEFANATLKNFDAPGMAVAVIKDGNVILSKGFGLRDVKNNLPVTPKTMFAIGSSTKSFTVVSLGTLVDEGKLDWDKPVREYLPDFRLYDKVATEEMTPRDLVTHRSGLPRHDQMWYASGFTRKEIYDRLRFLEPSHEFRSVWQYQNLMFMTAGYLASKVADMPWEDHIRRKIFAPLDMATSNFSVNDMQKAAEPAHPYMKIKEKVQEVPYRNIDQIGPAGSINSTVEEMIHYVQFHLDKGKFHGKQILSAGNVREMQTQQMVMPGEPQEKELSSSSYGMGFMITNYQGHKLVHHGGNIDGFSALVSFMPHDNMGLVVLTNANGSPVPAVVERNVYDRLLGIAPVDWTKRLKDAEAKTKAAADEAKTRKLTAQRPNTHPSHDLAEYAGEFEHPAYGLVKIAQTTGGLAITFSHATAPLTHFHYDVFEVAETERFPLSKDRVQFQTNLQGDISSLSIPIETGVKAIVFARRGDASMRQRSFL